MSHTIDELGVRFGRVLMSITTLNAVFDESGKQDKEQVVFAGAYATSQQWDAFSREWNTKLHRKGLKTWHTVDANNVQNEFKKFRKRRKELDELALSLADTFCKYVFGAQATNISMAEYRKLSQDLRVKFKDPFYCAFQSGIKSLLADPSVDEDDRFNLICDDSDEYSSECLVIYRRFRKLEPKMSQKIGSLCFVNDDTYPPIQAADLLAFCRRRELENKSEPAVWGQVVEKIYKRFSTQDRSDVYP